MDNTYFIYESWALEHVWYYNPKEDNCIIKYMYNAEKETRKLENYNFNNRNIYD